MANYKPLYMLHGYEYPMGVGTLDNKKRVIEETLDRLADEGYGGIVTNTEHNDNYLYDEQSWELLRYSLQYAANKHNMKLWLYDEKGYPSGGAGGLTLKEYPDGEAKALVMIKKEVAASDKISVEKPHGHEMFESAYLLEATGKTTDLAKMISGDRLEFTAHAGGTLYCFVSKRLFEGTHAHHNVCAARRYVSVTDKRAVAAFIDNTYRKYMEKVADLGLSRENLQAFFTDEPSLQCCYLNAGLTPPTVDDAIDEEVPLLPLVAWEKEILVFYGNRYGEDLKFKLHFLFDGNSPEAMAVRYKFYTLISDLYEEAYFKQIGNFCEDNNISFSGHILLEECVLHHAIFEGNYFNLLRHMHVPGIDMLFTKPKNVLRNAATPKLVSSIAAWYGKKQVMSEVSGHTESALGIPYDFSDVLCAQYVQFALGVNVFNSYFRHNSLTLSENRTLCSAIDRLCNEFDGKQDMSNILVYYPIESAQVSLLGSDKQLGERQFSEDALKCEQTWRESIDELIKEQIMFHCADTRVLASAEYSVEKKAIINNGCRAEYKAIIVPHPVAMSRKTFDVLTDLAAKGFCVIVIDFTQNLIVLEDGSRSNDSKSVVDLEKAKHFVLAKDVRSAVEAAKKALTYEYEFTGEMENIISLAKKDVETGEISCFIVSTGDERAKIALHSGSSKSEKNYINLMNPENGLCYNVDAENLVIEAKKGIIVKFGKRG